MYNLTTNEIKQLNWGEDHENYVPITALEINEEVSYRQHFKNVNTGENFEIKIIRKAINFESINGEENV